MSFPFYEVAVHQALFAPRGYVSTCAPITRNRTDLLYANECVCMCVCERVCDEGGCLPAADVGVLSE